MNDLGTAYPWGRAIRMAKVLASVGRSRFRELLDDPCIHGHRFLLGACESRGIHVRKEPTLPGGLSGISLRVKDRPFIFLSDAIKGPEGKAPKGERTIVLAHELAHHLLGHCIGSSSRIFGTIGTMGYWAADAQQEVYRVEVELEADLLAMMLVFPDVYLHEVVEERIFIPTLPLADDHGFRVPWVQGRVELYRAMYGYERSEELVRQGISHGLMGPPDVGKWLRRHEEVGSEGLSVILPELSSRAACVLNGSIRPC